MDSREVYEASYNYQLELQRAITGPGVTIDFSKLDAKSQGELRDQLNRFFIRRRSEIYNNILSGVHNF